MRSGFSLLELMIVVTILGVLSALMIPLFATSESESKRAALLAEMRAIQTAYIDFYHDNFPPTSHWKSLSRYGLYPLCCAAPPIGFNSSDWSASICRADDPANRLGWNGPYLMHEQCVEVNVRKPGQEAGWFPIPVVIDPYGGHYRVLCSVSNKLSLICTGPNAELDTTGDRVDPFGWIIPCGDDTPFPLLPFAGH